MFNDKERFEIDLAGAIAHVRFWKEFVERTQKKKYRDSLAVEYQRQTLYMVRAKLKEAQRELKGVRK